MSNTNVDESVQIPPRGDDRWLFALRIGGYSIRAWDTHRREDSRSWLGIVASKGGKVVFLTDQWSP